MELSYRTPTIRAAANDGSEALRVLGEDLARSFRSLVADMRDAIYLREVPGEPVAYMIEGKPRLNYPLGKSAVLEVEPVGIGANDLDSWGDVHRLKLLRITSSGNVLA